MFVGHFAAGFASKRLAPHCSLGVLTTASLLPDLLWPVFLLLKWEHVLIRPGDTAFTPLAFVHYPISHSLLTTLGWAFLAAGFYWMATRYHRGALAVGLLVMSHWLLDAVTHKPDLPLFPGSDICAGLGLWNSAAGTIAVESLIFAAGVSLYARLTKSRGRAGTAGMYSFIAVLLVFYLLNAAGPPPPGVRAIAFAGLATWLFPLWAAWFDRQRTETRRE